MISFEWRDLAWMVAVAVALGGLLLAFLRFKLAGDFAPRADLVLVQGRISIVETRLAQVPSHDDLRGLQARVAGLETGVAVVGEKVNSLGDIMRRVEHQTNLLVTHQINGGSS
ncbi:DUF2730 family protein [Humitalea sp. 24SJ18S-53]|uniref:DUF2730 family protein n=1 Tax=Humitalea sp. 24SJ18S-53 TaxID=3422307 RepID=UPI003D66B33B